SQGGANWQNPVQNLNILIFFEQVIAANHGAEYQHHTHQAGNKKHVRNNQNVGKEIQQKSNLSQIVNLTQVMMSIGIDIVMEILLKLARNTRLSIGQRLFNQLTVLQVTLRQF